MGADIVQGGQALFANCFGDRALAHAVATADLGTVREGGNGGIRVCGGASPEALAKDQGIAKWGDILGFAEHLAREAHVAVSPGIGFGPDGDGFVRFALVENEQRIRQAVRAVRRLPGLA